MEPKNEGFEADLPFKTGDFQVFAVNFPGCMRFFRSNLVAVYSFMFQTIASPQFPLALQIQLGLF